jgi:flagellar biosynthesis/type III secretory pathway protein FliH
MDKEILLSDIESTKRYIELAEQRVKVYQQDLIDGTYENVDETLERLNKNAQMVGELNAELKKLEEQLNKTVGRPSLGTTKKVSLTLPDEVWDMIETEKENMPLSAYLRFLIMQKFRD